jgi:hypothetical protein
MSNIIDHSEKIKVLAVGIGDTVTIEKDAHTPVNETRVHVTAAGISLGLGSTVLVQHHAILTLNGLGSLSLLGNIDIGDHGKVVLRGAISAGVLSSIDFVGHTGPAVLQIDTSNLNLPGAINGFGADDRINLMNLTATSFDYTANLLGGGGTITFFDGTSEVGQLGLTGNYSDANFAIEEYQYPSGASGTRLNFVPSGNAQQSAAAAFSPPEHFAADSMFGGTPAHF